MATLSLTPKNGVIFFIRAAPFARGEAVDAVIVGRWNRGDARSPPDEMHTARGEQKIEVQLGNGRSFVRISGGSVG